MKCGYLIRMILYIFKEVFQGKHSEIFWHNRLSTRIFLLLFAHSFKYPYSLLGVKVFFKYRFIYIHQSWISA